MCPAEICKQFSLEYSDSVCPYSHQQVFVPAAHLSISPCNRRWCELLQNAFQFLGVDDVLVRHFVVNELLFLEPMRDFHIGLINRA